MRHESMFTAVVRPRAVVAWVLLTLADATAAFAQQPGAPPQGRQGPPPGALADANDPPNLRELSEKDVLNVLVHGDIVTVVPVTMSRTWAEAMKALNTTHQYLEVAAGDHGGVISGSMPDIFAFFAKYSRPAAR